MGIFKDCYKTIKTKIKQSKKAKKTQNMKFFEATYLLKVLVYKINDDYIPRIDLKSAKICKTFIALNLLVQKYK